MQGKTTRLVLTLLTLAGPVGADAGPMQLPLAEPVAMESGVYSPWTDRCLDSRAPVRRKMYVRQPAGPGPSILRIEAGGADAGLVAVAKKQAT